MVSSQRKSPRLSVLLALSVASLFLFGCAGRDLITLDNRYEKTRLPAHFDRETSEDEDYVTLAVGRRQTAVIAYTATDSARVSARNASLTVDGSLLLESGGHQ